jgi:hypothetical protein
VLTLTTVLLQPNKESVERVGDRFAAIPEENAHAVRSINFPQPKLPPLNRLLPNRMSNSLCLPLAIPHHLNIPS